MYYKQYGDTGMRVSAVGFGTMRYSDEDVQAGRYEKCAEVVQYAYQKGINYFDTAPFYCRDKSEMITGMALSCFKRDSYFLSSKTNFGAVGSPVSRDGFLKRLETTLTRLKTDYLDFYHLWCMLTPEDFEKQCAALYPFFEEAKREGIIRNIVCSVHLQGEDIRSVVETGKFKGLLLGYNALNYQFRQIGLEAAYQNKMGVVVMNPLGGGLIAQNPETFSYLCRDDGLTAAQAALRFVASHKEVTVTLAGCTTKEHVDDAVKAVENLEELPARKVCEAYETAGKVSLNNLCTSCGYCNHCPKEIPTPKLMDAYNHKILTGDFNMIRFRLADHWDIPMDWAEKCVACGRCEKLCTQHLPIIGRLLEIAELSRKGAAQ